MNTAYIAILSLMWGSFLNMAGYRILRPASFKKTRSFCPHCMHSLSWHELIPVISWIILSGKCLECQKPISWLYPFIELLTMLLGTLLYLHVPHHYFFAYAFFFSTLIITIRTDLEQMLVSRFATTYLVWIGPLLAWCKLLPITLFDSLGGALFGYSLLYAVQKLFWLIKKQEGLGDGDLELLCYIGSFTGIFGAWTTLTLSSILGTIIGCAYLVAHKNKQTLFPFAPALATGAILYILYSDTIIYLYHLLSI